MEYVLWALAGWCGTPYPGPWRGPRAPQPPEPWWAVKIASMIGGVAGGWMTHGIVGHLDESGIMVLTTLAGALVTGGFLGGIVGLFGGGRGNVAAG